MKKAIEFIKKNWMVMVLLVAFAISIPIEIAYNKVKASNWDEPSQRTYESWELQSDWQYIHDNKDPEKLETKYAFYLKHVAKYDELTFVDMLSLIYTGTCHPESMREINWTWQ